MTFAVIQTGGKQYKVAVGDKLKIEKLPQPSAGENLVFEKVLLVDDGEKTLITQSDLAKAKVGARFIEEGRRKKVVVVKFKNKTRIRVKRGHRQPFTAVEIANIDF